MISRAGRIRTRKDEYWLNGLKLIYSILKVVKSWDLNQFMAMGKEQRDAIRKALNEDAEKLLQQGDPADPQLRRLQREIDEVRND